MAARPVRCAHHSLTANAGHARRSTPQHTSRARKTKTGATDVPRRDDRAESDAHPPKAAQPCEGWKAGSVSFTEASKRAWANASCSTRAGRGSAHLPTACSLSGIPVPQGGSRQGELRAASCRRTVAQQSQARGGGSGGERSAAMLPHGTKCSFVSHRKSLSRSEACPPWRPPW